MIEQSSVKKKSLHTFFVSKFNSLSRIKNNNDALPLDFKSGMSWRHAVFRLLNLKDEDTYQLAGSFKQRIFIKAAYFFF